MRTRILLAILILLTATGFASRFFRQTDTKGPPLLPVRGQIHFGNKPLELLDDDFGKIWLYPNRAKGNDFADIPAGTISEDGSFTIFTRGKEGAPAGWYRVVLLANRTRDPEHPNQKRKTVIPRAFNNPDETTLEILVEEKEEGFEYDISIFSDKKRLD